MKRIRLLMIFCLPVVMLFCCVHTVRQPVDYVNPFFNTSGDHGQLFPGPVMPFGMVKLGPDSYPSGFNGKAHSGYNYLDEKIMGFSLVRLGGEGCSGAGGNILFLPFIGQTKWAPADYSLILDKKSERAQPGYYRIDLGNPGIACELTTTLHAGMQRYVFPKNNSCHILLDLRRGFTEVRDASITVVDHTHIEGFVTAGQLCGSLQNYTVYFWAELDQPIKKCTVFQHDREQPATCMINGGKIVLAMDFDSETSRVIQIKTGVSTVGVKQARENCLAEIPDWSFARVRKQALTAWNDYLSSIRVSGSEEYKRLFYTALYHSCQMPVHSVNADGTFQGTDSQTHQAQNFTYYDSWSLWDTYRTKYPLFSLIRPVELQDIVRSFIKIYQQGGDHWPFLTIRREHMVAVIADAYAKGLRDYDVDAAYQGMRRDAYEFRAEFGNAAAGIKSKMDTAALREIYEQYDRLGFMPKRPDRTLENSYDNWCVAQMARSMNKKEDYEHFSNRAKFYRNVWDAEIGFFRARDEKGDWLPFPDPTVIDETYVYEATSWQWRWFVLHDMPGLIGLVGGKEKFLADLNYFFKNDLYNHNNEQDLHVAFLFNEAGAPWRAQEMVNQILTKPMKQIYGPHGFYKTPYLGRVYKAEPAGYIPEMDDDCGTMASWYVLASMGLYQICVGDPVFQLTSPLFDHIEIQLNPVLHPGKKFSIKAEGLAENCFYIQSARLNGKPLNASRLRYEDIINGGELVYQMGSTPNEKWGLD